MIPAHSADGLREDELASIEATYGFRFPPDLRTFLTRRPPISQYDRVKLLYDWVKLHRDPELVVEDDQEKLSEEEWWGWMNWRAPRAEIEAQLAEPRLDVAAAFTNSDYWLLQWGDRPPSLEDRMRFLSEAPVLIPIGGQHYMPAEPADAGNPIFSICYGIDIIVAGCDLEDYLAGGVRSAATNGAARHIRFWSDILYGPWGSRAVLDELRRGFGGS